MESKTGVLLCHGHTDPSLPSWLPNIKWIYVNLDPKTEPDVIANTFDGSELISKLGYEKYEYVVDMHCPSSGNLEEVALNANKLLKPGGNFIVVDGIGGLFSLLISFTKNNRYDLEKRYSEREPKVIDYVTQSAKMITKNANYERWSIPARNNQLSNDLIFIKENRSLPLNIESKEPIERINYLRSLVQSKEIQPMYQEPEEKPRTIEVGEIEWDEMLILGDPLKLFEYFKQFKDEQELSEYLTNLPRGPISPYITIFNSFHGPGYFKIDVEHYERSFMDGDISLHE